MALEQKREHFRIVYPVGQHAKIFIKKREYKVQDISQRGVRFQLEGKETADHWDIGNAIKGSVTFLHGGRAIVSGAVLRTVDDRSIVLYLDEPMELKLMFDEHRFVIQNFVTNADG